MELKEARANEDRCAEAVQGGESGVFERKLKEVLSVPSLAYKLTMSDGKGQSSKG